MPIIVTFMPPVSTLPEASIAPAERDGSAMVLNALVSLQLFSLNLPRGENVNVF